MRDKVAQIGWPLSGKQAEILGNIIADIHNLMHTFCSIFCENKSAVIMKNSEKIVKF